MAITHTHWHTRARIAPRRSAVPRTLLLQAGAGVAFGVLAASLLLLTDAFGLRRLMMESTGIGAIVLFILGGITTFAPLFVATALGLLAEHDSDARHPPSER
jgi:hypothetical protein